MSLLGQERTLATTFVMPALPPGTDIKPLIAGQLSRLSEDSLCSTLLRVHEYKPQSAFRETGVRQRAQTF